MSKVKIKTETPPNRCEICHQSDCFDTATLTCQRCSNLPAIDEQQLNNPQTALQEKEDYFKMLEEQLSAQRVTSQQVKNRFSFAAGMVMVNMGLYIALLMLLNFNRMLWVSNIVIITATLLLVEYYMARILTDRNKLMAEAMKTGLLLSSVVILFLFILMVLFSPSFRPLKSSLYYRI